MTTAPPRWRTQDQKPPENRISALIAIADERSPSGPFLYGLAWWEAGQWRDEETGKLLGRDRYWWVPECELVETLPK